MKRVIVAVSLAAVATLAAAPAQASTSPAGFASRATNAGYVALPHSAREIAASWVVPTVSCEAADAAVRIGVGLANSTSGRFAKILVDVNCRDSVPSYVAVFHLSDGGLSRLGKVGPGDQVEAKMTARNGHFSASFTDDTRGWGTGLGTKLTLNADQAAVLVSESNAAAGGVRPLADFGTVQVTGMQVDGKPVDSPVQRLVMRPAHGQAKVRTSKLQTPSGDFSMTWLRA